FMAALLSISRNSCRRAVTKTTIDTARILIYTTVWFRFAKPPTFRNHCSACEGMLDRGPNLQWLSKRESTFTGGASLRANIHPRKYGCCVPHCRYGLFAGHSSASRRESRLVLPVICFTL